MKILVLAPFVKIGTIHGMVEGMVAAGHQWESISTDPKDGQINNPRFVDQVLGRYDSGGFDTIFVGKGSSIPLGNFKALTSKADVTYWCPDSVSGNGCGPPGRPEDVGARGLECARIICTGSEGCRWWRAHGFKGRIAQIYQGCRHSIWRPDNLDAARLTPKQIVFLGSGNYKGDGGRRAKLAALTKNGFNVRSAKRIYHRDAANLYYNSSICLNMVCGTPNEGHTPVGITSNRLVRLLTSGGFALTERNTDVAASFEEGNQLATYSFGDIPDLSHETNALLWNGVLRHRTPPRFHPFVPSRSTGC